MDGSTIASLIGALGIGSTLGQWITGGRARRETRARVLNALAEAEQQRWSSGAVAQHQTFDRSMRELRTAALLARIPRPPIDLYEELAQTAYFTSFESCDSDSADGSETLGGGIDSDLDEAVRRCVQIIVRAAWNPYQSRVFARRSVKRANAIVDKIASEHIRYRIGWNRSYLHGKQSAD